MRTWVRFYMRGGDLAIETNDTDEKEFLVHVGVAFSKMITDNKFKLEREREWFLPQLLFLTSEIVCKLRGYKASVVVQQLLRVGSISPSDDTLFFKWPSDDMNEAAELLERKATERDAKRHVTTVADEAAT